MLFDWFTIVAQLINFLVLVWLLRRFLYKPVLNAIDERERKISASLQQADTLQARATAECERFSAQTAELAHQRDTLLRQATVAAQAERDKLMEQARQDAALLRVKQAEALQHDMQAMAQTIKQRTYQEALALTRTALGELSGVSLEQRIVESFMAKLQTLNDQDRHTLQTSMALTDTVQVRSAFTLTATQQQQLTQQIQSLLHTQAAVHFDIAPNLIGGIELITDGHKLEWNLAAFVTTVNEQVLQTS